MSTTPITVMPDWTERLTAEERKMLQYPTASASMFATALADARLELQQAKDSRDGFACDLDHAESEVAVMKAYWIHPDRADAVAYELGGKIATLEAEVARLAEDRDQQREDIRRLAGVLLAREYSAENEYGSCCPFCKATQGNGHYPDCLFMVVHFEFKEKYGA